MSQLFKTVSTFNFFSVGEEKKFESSHLEVLEESDSSHNTMASEHQIKMVLTNEKEIRTDILKKDDPTTHYIILQNQKYQILLETLTNENVQLKLQIEEQENEIDSLTKGKVCLQGYMKNEYEFAQNWKQLSYCYQSFGTKMHSWFNLITTLYTTLMLASILINDLLVIRIFIGVCTIVYGVAYINESINFYRVVKSDNIMTIKKQIEKIEKSNQYILDLIDNI